MQSNVQPLFGSAVFTVSRECEIHQVLIYDYADPEGVYKALVEDETEFRKEIKRLRQNMNAFLAAEKVYINDQRVTQEILHVDIGFRGSADIPYFQWVIHFQGFSRTGINSLKSVVEEERAEYDLEVLYLFPVGTDIIEVKTPMEYDIQRSLLLVWAREGDKVGGYEEVCFRLPPSE
ncbi:MAG: hypothetical protein ACFE8F_01370 [Promethearchaeota archaeon]